MHGESGQRGTDYSSSSANWTLTGTNIAALDAHYGVSQTMLFTKQILTATVMIIMVLRYTVM